MGMSEGDLIVGNLQRYVAELVRQLAYAEAKVQMLQAMLSQLEAAASPPPSLASNEEVLPA